MLDWLLKNPQILIFIVFGVIALLGRIAQARKEAQTKREREMRTGKQPPAAQPSMRDTSAADAGEAERTRRIQEEVRRKILARMERQQAPTSMPRTIGHADATPPPLPAAQRAQSAPSPAEDESASAYRSAMQQLAEMQARAAESRSGGDNAFAIESRDSEGTASPSAGLHESLRNASELRRAIILREILDKPVSLRG